MDATSPTVGDYGARWLARMRCTARPNTLRIYEITLRLHLAPLAAVPLGALSRATCITFAETFAKQDYAAATIRLTLSILRALCESAVEDGLLDANPATRLSKRFCGRARRGHPISREDLARLVTAWPAHAARSASLFGCLLYTGLRIGEALGLQWSDVDLERRTLRVARTWHDTHAGPCKTAEDGEAAEIDLLDEAVTLFDRLERHPSGWIFPNPETGEPWRQSLVHYDFSVAAVAAGCAPQRYTPHALRHTFATLLLEAGYPLAFVQQQLRHYSIATTRDLYARSARVPPPSGLSAFGAASGEHRPPATPMFVPKSSPTPASPPLEPAGSFAVQYLPSDPEGRYALSAFPIGSGWLDVQHERKLRRSHLVASLAFLKAGPYRDQWVALVMRRGHRTGDHLDQWVESPILSRRADAVDVLEQFLAAWVPPDAGWPKWLEKVERE